MDLLREGFRVIEKKGIKYVADENGMPLYSKPWIGNIISFLYDFLMKKVVFPGNLNADYDKHEEIIKTMLKDIENKRILELAAGSGYTAELLSPVNDYIGTDISPGLLKIAKKKFEKKGFRSTDLYVLSAENIPFKENSFDICLCILSLNFFNDLNSIIRDLAKVMCPSSQFICCVPVPERNERNKKIEGTLYSEKELSKIFTQNNFKFETFPENNGSILYFRAARVS